MIHGPKPKDWSYTIPRKAKKEALRCAVLSKFNDNEIRVVEDLGLETPKTNPNVKTSDRATHKLFFGVSNEPINNFSIDLIITKTYNPIIKRP